MLRHPVVEGEPIVVDAETARKIRHRVQALQDEIRPTVSFLGGTDVAPVIWNLVGSVEVAPDLIIDIEPKTRPGENWAAAVLDLMTNRPASFGGENDTAEITHRRVLPDAFAGMYERELRRAVRREGPLAVMRRRDVSQQSLSGRLDVTRWLTERVLRPAHFPQTITELSVDNSFTSALAWVAELLARNTSGPELKSRLRALAIQLRPGLPAHVTLDAGVALREVPSQWRAYGPAWSIARSVIRRISPLEREGVHQGLSLALEAWPLLEQLLHNSLADAAGQAAAEGLPVTWSPQETFPLLSKAAPGLPSALNRLRKNRSVEPDGLLKLGDSPVASFEAKYSVPGQDAFREHYFQALTTAAAIGSPLSVIVYPEKAMPTEFDVAGFGDRPAKLIVVGLDMYGYRHGSGGSARGNLLLDIVRPAIADLLTTKPAA